MQPEICFALSSLCPERVAAAIYEDLVVSQMEMQTCILSSGLNLII